MGTLGYGWIASLLLHQVKRGWSLPWPTSVQFPPVRPRETTCCPVLFPGELLDCKGCTALSGPLNGGLSN